MILVIADEFLHMNGPFEWQKLAEFGQFTNNSLGKFTEFGHFLLCKRPIPMIIYQQHEEMTQYKSQNYLFLVIAEFYVRSR